MCFHFHNKVEPRTLSHLHHLHNSKRNKKCFRLCNITKKKDILTHFHKLPVQCRLCTIVSDLMVTMWFSLIWLEYTPLSHYLKHTSTIYLVNFSGYEDVSSL